MNTPLAERISIVLTGETNAGKSSLLNCIMGKNEAIVSEVRGTTTDPVTRTMELLPLGPVAITDTAGFSDSSSLGQLRSDKTEAKINTADILLFVSASHTSSTEEENFRLAKILDSSKPCIVVLTNSDKAVHPSKEKWEVHKPVMVNCLTGEGRDILVKKLASLADKIKPEPTPLEGLVKEGDHILLVTPIDLAAPKGRMILPQVETIRDALDKDCIVTIVKERELASALENFKRPPALVITDSQAFSKVAADLDHGQKLTSFSILFARKKGGLNQMIDGLSVLDSMKAGARVMVLEACSHHKQADDIASVKIPRLYRQLVHSDVEFVFEKGMPDTEHLKSVDLVIHCGGCMVTRNQMLARLKEAGRAEVPVTNFGLFLSWANGLFPRALEPLPEYQK